MLCERDELVVELNRPARRVVAHDERARIVHQNFLRHAAEVVNALSIPANQCSCFSARNARTCSPRECPSVATTRMP